MHVNEANESDADAAIGKYLQEVYAQLVTQNIDDGAKSLMSNRMLLIKRDLDHQAKYLKPDVATVKIAGITHKAQANCCLEANGSMRSSWFGCPRIRGLVDGS